MGLDMYLFKRKKFRENDKEYNELVRDAEEEVCYWRKANEIRNWFVYNTDLDEDDNCRFIELTREDLVYLKNDCIQVLENHSLADEIMPTASGFFFGSVDYDEYYFDSLEYTVKKIDEILENTDFNTEVIEYYEWW